MDSTEPSSIGTGQAYQVYDQPNGIVNGRPLKNSLRRLVVAIFSHSRKLTPFFFSFFLVCVFPSAVLSLFVEFLLFWPIACLVCLLGCFVVICVVSSFWSVSLLRCFVAVCVVTASWPVPGKRILF